MTELLLYGGKGGVGKTTCAAATGLSLARRGNQTLVVSTDPAHSLADAYGTAIGDEPTHIETGTEDGAVLQALEVDPETGTDRYRRVFDAVTDELSRAGFDPDDSASELFGSGGFPGGDELAALDALAAHLDDDRWEHVVLDTAPTGHTLQLLDMPETVGRGVATARSLRDQVKRKADAARTMLFGPYAPGRGTTDEPFTEVVADTERVADALRDPERTAFRVVTLPEPMVLQETERLVSRLRETGVPLGPVVVNRVLEEVDEDCARCSAQRERQRGILAEMETTFEDLDSRRLPDLTGREEGRTALSTLASRLGDLRN